MLPPEYLRHMLAAARGLGYPFEVAWPQALARAAAIGDDRAGWLVVLSSTHDSWQRAYDGGAPLGPEEALAAVAHDRQPDRVLDARRCEWCDRWVASDRDPRARFCSERCKRRFNYERERLRTEGGSGGATVEEKQPADPGAPHETRRQDTDEPPRRAHRR